MGRRAEGLRITWKRGWAYARFTHEGADHRVALGTRDPGEARARAAAEYAAALSGRRRKAVARQGGAERPLPVLLAEWIADSAGVLDETTCATLETYAKHYLGFFRSLDEMTRESVRDYTRARLRAVLRRTVLKELSFLRGFLAWAVDQGALDEAPVVDPPPGKATGVRSGKQRAIPVAITEDQARAIVAGLPIESKRIGGRRWPVRARFLVAWETGLRPETLARLSVPEHYRAGAAELVLDDADDKARFGRTLPLTPAARAALDAVAPPKGLIFGAHRFDKVLKASARKVLGADIAKRFAPYDFRHGRGTQLVDEGAPLTGVAFLLGHRQVTTTNRYAKPNRRAADRALEAVGAAPFPPPVAGGGSGHGGEVRGIAGVTDGVRTRDNWSHNAGGDREITTDSPSRARPATPENVADRQDIRPGGGFLERACAALDTAFAEERAEAEAWASALDGALDGDEGVTLAHLAALAGRVAK